MDPTKDDELFREVIAHPEQGQKWNDLLSRFWKGLSGERLRELLTHTDVEVVRGGLFLADEICDLAHPVLREIVALAEHPDAKVRWSAYLAIRSCARKGQEAIFVHVLHGLLDSDVSCRICAMTIVAQTKDRVLSAVLPVLGEADVALREGVEGLFRDASEQLTLITKWGRMEAIYRRFAAIAAARDRSHWLMLAWLVDACDDADIRDFAVRFTRPRVARLVENQEMIERAAKKKAGSEVQAAAPVDPGGERGLLSAKHKTSAETDMVSPDSCDMSDIQKRDSHLL